MKTKINTYITLLTLAILCGACKNQAVDFSLFEIADEQVQPESNSVAISGSFSFTGEVNGMKVNMGLDEQLVDAVTYLLNLEGCDFSVSIDSLKPNTTYFYRYSIDFGFQKDYLLEARNFTTLQGVPEVKTIEVTRVDSTSYYVMGRVVTDNGSPITERGVCWNTSGNPDPLTDEVIKYSENGIGEYKCLLSQLAYNTKYYVCAYAKNTMGIGCGEVMEFETPSQPEELFEIALKCNPEEGGFTSGDGIYEAGAQCTVTATANAGFTFTDWSENGIVVSNQANYTFTVNGNRTIMANFQALPQNYLINVSVNPTNGGAVSGDGTYQQGQSCTLEATANNGYTFTNWTENGDVVYTNTNYTFTVNGNRTLVANFTQQSYNITVSANPSEGGSTTGGGIFHFGDNCTVSAIANNGYTFTNWTENEDEVSTNTNYTFTVNGNRTLVANFTDAHEYVNLGLPSGLLWATCNIGAATPEDYGDYFAWGETQPKDSYDWSTYQYCNGSYNTLTKYCNSASNGYNGFVDNLTVLEASDDAATAQWGTGWRMPTKEEWQELYQNTTHIWTTQNGVNGRLFTASNGNSLFLPAAGYYHDGSSLFNAGSLGYYWSSSLYTTGNPYSAWYFGFGSDDWGMSHKGRDEGRSVRPVKTASKK